MARGQQKIQSQQKNAKKQQDAKKNTVNSKVAAQAALKVVCSVCRSQMGDLKTYRQHFESKHPKADLPPELQEAACA